MPDLEHTRLMLRLAQDDLAAVEAMVTSQEGVHRTSLEV
jgi:hypothetical protein